MSQPTYLDDGVHPRFSNLTEARLKGTIGVSGGVLYVSLDSAAASYGVIEAAGAFAPSVYVNDSSSTPQTLALRATATVNNTTLTAPSTGIYRMESTIEFATTPTNIVAQALLDLNAMVTQIQALTSSGGLSSTISNGQVIVPGVFDLTGASTASGTTTFDAAGDADAIFVVRVSGTMTFNAGNTHALANGAQACNIYWLLAGAASAGGGADLKGNIICIAGGMAPGGGLDLEGRLLSTSGALSLTGSTQVLPSGTPSTDLAIDLNLLAEFAYYTGVGTIADSTQAGGAGSVGSGSGGTITLGKQVGTIYTTTSVAMDVHFDVKVAGVTQPDCTRHFEGNLTTHGSSVILMCVASVNEGDTILTSFESTLGGVVIGNRGALVWRLA